METKFFSNIIAKGAGLGPRQIRIRASDETKDRVGDILEAAGCDLGDYRRNPIVLFSHDPSQPVGTASLSLNGKAIEGVITFAPEGASQRADETCSLAKAGVLSGVSVGFDPVEVKPYPLGYLIKKWTLLEVSLVAVPCNPSATILERSYGSSSRSAIAAEVAAICDRAKRADEIYKLRQAAQPVAMSHSERMARIAILEAATPSAPPNVSMRQILVLNEHNRVLDMSRRLYARDPDVQKAERKREVERLKW